ncbi:hypothetical protein GQ53DRAFT_836171 [Thozetella sp. PMI_491]|nr:hypothetical protein GQ53DRAFT_836171 [Thozetella sp. PMI_491]
MRRQTFNSSASASSPQLRVFGRKPTWEEQLRRTDAARDLQRASPDRFPLRELQRVTDAFVRSSPSTTSSVLRKKTVEPRTQECDLLLGQELVRVRGELYVHEAAVVACLHALTCEYARGHLLALRLDGQNTDEFFDRRLPVYLQAVILARKANPEACSEDEATAATELLAVVKGNVGDFPAIVGLLKAVGRGTCDELLPTPLVSLALKRSHYRVNLSNELDNLLQQRRWFDAYKLVAGLRGIIGLPKADALLQDVFPEYPMWACWRPNTRRITAWESPRLEPFKRRIGPILDLEGPDTTGQQLGTLRMSSPGAFTTLTSPDSSNDRFLLDRMLDVLDACLSIGSEAIALFVYVCVDRYGVSDRGLERIEAALELRDDSAAKILTDLLRGLQPDATVNARMLSFTAALPVLQYSQRLQAIYGMDNDLAFHAPVALSAVQKQLCKMVDDRVISESFGLQVLALGNVLRQSTWLHALWQPGYVHMLSQMPSEIEVRNTIRALKAADSESSDVYADFLAVRLGASRRRDRTAWPSEPPTMSPDDPISVASLDSDRANLQHILHNIDSVGVKLIRACARQALEETDACVRELVSIIVEDTDQVCVNLASFLGPRVAMGQDKVDDCWRTLLLQMMRGRPLGMLERCGETLPEQSWLHWVENLRRIFGERHLGDAGGCGFSNEAFAAMTQRKLGMGRTLSASTNSTDSTGQMSMGFPSPIF